jgi:CYTH domain-containing protein/predicted ATPase
MKNRIYHICITGGPCAGKTSLFSYALRSLADFGYKVFIVEEAATQVIMTGLDPGSINQKDFQRIITRRICANENMITNMITLWNNIYDNKIIVLYDRSHTDSSAYCNSYSDYVDLLSEVGLTPQEEIDKFDKVIHLVTAADGAEEFYNLDNPARYETPEQARSTDLKTRQAWSTCSHLRFVGNNQSFNKKMKEALGHICHTIGIPKPVEIERKWIIDKFVTEKILKNNGIDVIGTVDIEQVYLPQGRIRKRHLQNSTYFLTHKKEISSGVRIETEERIDYDVYNALFNQRLKTHGIIRKKRINFEYKGQWFELDTFDNSSIQQILELELTDIDNAVQLPNFLGNCTDVTDNKEFYNENISRRIS